MTDLIRSTLIHLGCAALSSGLRFPRFDMADAFQQWAHLIDLTRRLNINVFLDIGANRGLFAKHLRMSGYRGQLFSFEPIPEDQEHIRMLAANDPNWTVCGYALGARSETREFQVNLCGDHVSTVMSSFLLLKGHPFGTHTVRTVPVELHRLDEVLPELLSGIETPRLFLKMDTQGFDEQVFEGASGYLDKILGIQSEVSVIPLYDGMPHYTESLARYERLGFKLMDLFVVNRTQDGRVLEYDCVMARLDALSEADLFG